MQAINKKIRVTFWFALGLSIGFPLGVLGIIFGAVGSAFVLMGVGILLTVGGFYGMPLLWVKYGDLRHDRTVIFMIEHEKLLTVTEIAAQTGYTDQDVRDRIVKMIRTHTLTGYIFSSDMLIKNEKRDNAEKTGTSKPCPQCGAMMQHNGERFRCEYCGYTE